MAETPDDLKILPLDALHRELGARMVGFAGYAMPIQYQDGIIAEHNWTRTRAGLFDVSHMGQALLSGQDAVKTLEALMPGDFEALREGVLRYSMLLTDEGGIIDDLMATRRADDFYLVVNGATKAGDYAHIAAHLIGDTKLETRDDWALLALQGPEAVQVLARLAPGVEELRFMRSGAFTLAGVPAWISRSGYTGEDGFEISIPAVDAEKVARTLLAEPEVAPIGLGARDSLRLEAGLPLYGHDIDLTTTPVEAGLSFAISKRRKSEGGFPAAEKILHQLFEGAPRKRVGLLIEGRLPAREGALVFVGDKQIGKVTSGGFAPTVGAPIAMAYVESAYAADGTALDVEVRGKKLAAKVVPMPFQTKNYVREGASK